MDKELLKKIRQLSKSQLEYVLEVIITFEPVNIQKVKNLIIYGSESSVYSGIRQLQTGDTGQVRADKQYKGN